MLVLSRKQGESLRIGTDVCVTVVSTSGGQVRLSIDAPEDVTIYREELYRKIVEANRAALSAGSNVVGDSIPKQFARALPRAVARRKVG